MISKEEKYLKSRIGKQNPFRVPEGYFDSFVERMMENLPEQKARTVVMPKPRRSKMLRAVLYAAACLCVAVLGTVIYWQKLSVQSVESSTTPVAAHTSSSSDAYVDAVADYAMMDNTDIYAYLSEE